MNPRLSIIIVNWNTRDLLVQCLASITTNHAGPLAEATEILVVDNASTDGSPDIVRRQFPQVHLIENKTNVGFARANNQAIRQSRGAYLLLLNSDTVVKRGALETLVRFLDEHPAAGAAGAQLFNPDGSLQTSCYPAPALSRELWHLFHLDKLWPHGSYRMASWDLMRPRTVDVLLGACLMVRRQVLDQVGLLDEDYFMYSEEVDLCTRIRRAGWHLYWVPEARIVHFGGQSTQQVAATMFLHLYQGKLLYFRKHHGRAAPHVYKLILMLAALSRLGLMPLAWLMLPSRRQRHRQLARHYGRLARTLPGM